MHTVDRTKQCRFSCSRKTDDSHKLALLNRKIDIVESNHAVGIYLGYV